MAAAGNPLRRELAPLCSKIGRETVDRVVQDFYRKLREDPDLAPFFARIADFPAHEAHVADFWWVAMGGRAEAHRPFDMVGRHAPLGLTPSAFQRWLRLFRKTVEEHLPPPLAAQWLQMAQGVGANLERILLGPGGHGPR